MGGSNALEPMFPSLCASALTAKGWAKGSHPRQLFSELNSMNRTPCRLNRSCPQGFWQLPSTKPDQSRAEVGVRHCIVSKYARKPKCQYRGKCALQDGNYP